MVPSQGGGEGHLPQMPHPGSAIVTGLYPSERFVVTMILYGFCMQLA